jgi:hypothetical protein
MLPPWMIEELERSRREQAEREERARLWIEIPASDRPEPTAPDRERVERGVAVIEVL